MRDAPAFARLATGRCPAPDDAYVPTPDPITGSNGAFGPVGWELQAATLSAMARAPIRMRAIFMVLVPGLGGRAADGPPRQDTRSLPFRPLPKRSNALLCGQ
jgi:hypothetical protein